MEINTSFSSGRLTLYLNGELDHHEARETMKSINEIIDEYMPRDLILEFSGLSFMDSSGIAVIVNTIRRMKPLHGRVIIENPAPQPQRVLDASGIERLVNISVKNKEGVV